MDFFVFNGAMFFRPRFSPMQIFFKFLISRSPNRNRRATMEAEDPVATINNASSALDSDSRSDARRRQAVAAAKKSVLEALQKGETEFKRPRDSPHSIKGKIAESTVSPRRRKSISKMEKPVWLTVLSILTKNCFLVMGLYILSRLILNWSDQLNGKTRIPFAALDLEEQVSDLKSSLKRTTKMMQFQLEVVDQKINSESETIKHEISKMIEQKIGPFDQELKKLGARSSSLENSLSELQSKGFLSKEEFEKFFVGFKKSQSIPERENKLFTLDEIRSYAREIVQKEMEKHAADGVGSVDFALASGGARVVRHSEAYVGKKGFWHLVNGRSGVHPDAPKMLQPSFGEPGQCFPLRGNSGFVEVKLRTAIFLRSITLEHVAKSVAYDRSSAPKDCKISAWLEPFGEIRTLAEFTYELEKSNVQSFEVEAGGAVNVVRLDFTSNHGSSSHTCIYRLRVHGSERHVYP